MEKRQTIGKINETKHRFLEKSNKIDKLLARLLKRKKTQIAIVHS